MLGVDPFYLGFSLRFQKLISSMAAFDSAAVISGKRYAGST
jgi:hypothetical protein